MSCLVRKFCLNNDPTICGGCCGELLLEDAEISERPLLYQPCVMGAPKHPLQELRKQRRKESKLEEKRRKQSDKYRKKSKLVKKAFKNEEETRQALVRATIKSGSVLHDGDTRIGSGALGIDDKLQTKATKQFTVKVDEVTKAESQNCVLIITTAKDEKFVVASLGLFCKAAKELTSAIEEYTTQQEA